MSLEHHNNGDNYHENKNKVDLSIDLVDILKNMESLEELQEELNLNNKRLTKLFNLWSLPEEHIISFIKWLEYYKKSRMKNCLYRMIWLWSYWYSLWRSYWFENRR